jgi:hypothetical protein
LSRSYKQRKEITDEISEASLSAFRAGGFGAKYLLKVVLDFI